MFVEVICSFLLYATLEGMPDEATGRNLLLAAEMSECDSVEALLQAGASMDARDTVCYISIIWLIYIL